MAKLDGSEKAVLAGGLFAIGLVLSFWGAVIYVAAHFISKFW